MSTEDTQLPPQADPFADVRDKRMGELSDEQKDRAYEMWLRKEMGGLNVGMRWPLGDVFEALLRVIDRLRQRTPSMLPIPPAPADAMDVAYAEGWNAACEAYFDGKPAPEPVVITISEKPKNDLADAFVKWFYHDCPKELADPLRDAWMNSARYRKAVAAMGAQEP